MASGLSFWEMVGRTPAMAPALSFWEMVGRTPAMAPALSFTGEGWPDTRHGARAFFV
jgi:hypothetical protein